MRDSRLWLCLLWCLCLARYQVVLAGHPPALGSPSCSFLKGWCQMLLHLRTCPGLSFYPSSWWPQTGAPTPLTAWAACYLWTQITAHAWFLFPPNPHLCEKHPTSPLSSCHHTPGCHLQRTMSSVPTLALGLCPGLPSGLAAPTLSLLVSCCQTSSCCLLPCSQRMYLTWKCDITTADVKLLSTGHSPHPHSALGPLPAHQVCISISFLVSSAGSACQLRGEPENLWLGPGSSPAGLGMCFRLLIVSFIFWGGGTLCWKKKICQASYLIPLLVLLLAEQTHNTHMHICIYSIFPLCNLWSVANTLEYNSSLYNDLIYNTLAKFTFLILII